MIGIFVKAWFALIVASFFVGVIILVITIPVFLLLNGGLPIK